MNLADIKVSAPDGRGRCLVGAGANLDKLVLLPGARWVKAQRTWSLPANIIRWRTPELPPPQTVSGIKVRQYQLEGAAFFEQPLPGFILGDDVGVGKQQPVTTPVLTPTGWRAIGHLRVGDEVISSTGAPVKVKGVYPQGVRAAYRITFSDGSSTEAGDEHLWTVAYWAGGRRLQELVLTTRQLRLREPLQLDWPNGRTTMLKLAGLRLFIPMLSHPVEYRSQALPVDPYLLGALIANGSLTASTPKLVTNAFDWEEVQSRVASVGCLGAVHKYGNCVHASFKGLGVAVRELGLDVLSGMKFIPHVYLRAAVRDRIALLQGLMDGDGSVSKTQNRLTYHTTSPALAHDVQQLVEELGGSASVREYDRTDEEKPVEYRVRLRLPATIAPFTVARKASRYRPGRHAQPSRSVVSVEYTRDVESVCIEVDAEDQLYVTEHAILTHNTLTLLTYLSRHPELRPFVVVGLLAATGSWVGPEADPAKHFGLHVEALRTRTPGEISPADGYFINYDILEDWLPALLWGIEPRVVVLDEAHEIRNVRTKASKACHKLCRAPGVAKRIALTATPVVNGVIDLYSVLDCVQPDLWGFMVPFNDQIKTSFGTRYCSSTHNGYGWTYPGESNVAELKGRLRSTLLRRSRFDVRKELPPFSRQRVSIDPEALDREAYRKYTSAALESVAVLKLTETVAPAGAELTRVNAMASSLSWAKRDIALRHAVELTMNAQTRKIVVFTWYKETAKYLAKELKRKSVSVFGHVTGEMSIDKRLQLAAEFRDFVVPEGGGAAYVATLGAAGIALNPLAAASSALVVDLYWIPSVLLQAEGRLHREGQKASNVLIQYLVVPDTIDTVMWETLQRKAKAIEKVTGDSEGVSLCEALGGRNEEENLRRLLHDLALLSEASLGLK